MKLTTKLARELGMGWYSVDLCDNPEPVTPATARAFLEMEADEYRRSPAKGPYPFAEILRALDAARETDRAAWFAVMCAAARAEIEAES